VFSWQQKGFKKKKNPDLWKRFLAVYPKHKIRFKWVKGHAGISENERADRLAVEASRKPNLPADEGYEFGNTDESLF
jgi:ribonuclease HI